MPWCWKKKVRNLLLALKINTQMEREKEVAKQLLKEGKKEYVFLEVVYPLVMY